MDGISPISEKSAEASEVLNRIPKQTLGQDEFLQLLVVQLTTQDPLDPQTDTEFIAQMANFTALEQTKAMSEEMSKLRLEQSVQSTLQANSLLGRQVGVEDESGELVTGIVSSVSVEAGTPRVTLNNQTYDLGQIVAITAKEK